jgi:hypothetical protein
MSFALTEAAEDVIPHARTRMQVNCNMGDWQQATRCMLPSCSNGFLMHLHVKLKDGLFLLHPLVGVAMAESFIHQTRTFQFATAWHFAQYNIPKNGEIVKQ